MTSRTLDVAGTELCAHEWGGQGAPAVLFWHALGDHTGQQVAEVATLLVQDFGLRVVALDAPGFGGSPAFEEPERYELSSVVPLALGAADGLALERPVFLGSSWGGSVALAAAATAPDRLRGIALLDSGYQPAMTGGESLEELREHWRGEEGFRFATWDDWREDAHAYFSRMTPELEEVLRSAYRERDGEVVSIMGPDIYATVIWALRREPWTTFVPRVGRTGVPVLMLAATEPPERRAERTEELGAFAADVPQAVIRHVEGAGHPLLEERPEQVARAVGEWALPLYA